MHANSVLSTGRAVRRLFGGSLAVAVVLIATSVTGQIDAYLVKDIAETGSSHPRSLRAVGARVYFFANGGPREAPSSESDLWVSDGTADGTSRVGSRGGGELVDVHGTIYVRAGAPTGVGHLLRLDDSATLVRVPNTGNQIERLAVVGDKLFFRSAYSLCVLGPAGENCLQRLFYQQQETAVGDLLFLIASPSALASPFQLWVSDGTVEGTRALELPVPIVHGIPSLTALGEVVYFLTYDDERGAELWSSDGTDSGTVQAADILSDQQHAAGIYVSELVAVREQLFFVLKGTIPPELWTLDGATPRLVKRFAEGVEIDLWNTFCDQRPCAPRNVEHLFFAALDSEHGRELWTSDGTDAGTRIVKDINRGPSPSNPTPITAVDGRLVFRACTDEAGCEIWISDGTATGTLRTDIARGAASSVYSECAAIGTLLLCSADDQIHGTELWAIESAVSPMCPGDCDGDGRVSIDELIVGVGMALGSQPIDACAAFDNDGSHTIRIAELVAAVGHALTGCV